MKKCKSCQTEISEKAKKCPNCQTDQRNWFLRHKIMTGILALVFLGVIISATGGGSDTAKQNSSDNTSAAAEAPKVAEAISVDALADDFDANQPAAEKKWKDRYVEFSAVVSNITDSGVSFYDVGSKEFSTTQVSCKVSNKDDLLALKNGETATVRGIVADQMLGVITINDCSIVK